MGKRRHGHCQSEKEIEDYLLAYQPFLKESHEVTRRANEQATFLKINCLLVFFPYTLDTTQDNKML
jgi:hypothetical protein